MAPEGCGVKRGAGFKDMTKPNLATTLRRKARSNPMHTYDALPHDARRWLASACLPWSP